MAKNKVLIVAAEASSALYAQRLLEEWSERDQGVEAFGVGSQSMEKLGFRCVGRSEEMAVVGFKEVLRHYPNIRNVFNEIIDDCKKAPPKFALLLDYPDFNLRLAKQLSQLGIRVIYYISPQMWAWRKGRIKSVKKYIDKMLVLFPFEKEFYQENGIDAAFVGHPLLDEMEGEGLDESSRAEQRSRIGMGSKDILIGLMPGSRHSELDHHLDIQIKTAQIIHNKHPSVRFALFVAPSLSLSEVKQKIGDMEFPLAIVQDEPLRMVNMADYVLTASGTATLVVGLMARPMIVMYRMNSLSAWLAKKVVKGVEHFAMVNLIMSDSVVPEFFQDEANPVALAEALSEWLHHPEVPAEIAERLKSLRTRLGDDGATKRVADELQEYFA